MRWAPVEGGVLKAGAALVHQMPTSRALAFSPDTTLKLERAATGEVGWEQRVRATTIDAVVYGRTMDRIATQQFGRPSFENEGRGRSYGLEVMLRREPIDRLFGWISYGLSRSERNDDPEATDEWVLFDLDQTHNLVAVGGVQLGRGWELSGRFQYTSGNPYTAYDRGIVELSDGSWTGVPSTEENGARLPPYYALDTRLSKAWRWDRGHLLAYLDVLGLVRGENPELVLNAYDYSETAFVSGLPTVPTLGLQTEWRF